MITGPDSQNVSRTSPLQNQPVIRQNPGLGAEPVPSVSSNPAAFENGGARAALRGADTASEGLTGWLANLFGGGGRTAGTAPQTAAGADTAAGVTPLGASAASSTDISFQALGAQIGANPNVRYMELERGKVNTGLSQHLSQFQQKLDANPELRDKLAQTEAGKALLSALDNAAKGQLGTDDIINLQKFIIASGERIGYPGNAEGVDGQYGPKTHEGLQKAFAAITENPDLAIPALDAGMATANQAVEALRTAQDGQIDRYVPGQTPQLAESSGVTPSFSATDMGNQILASARVTARGMSNSGLCMRGVRTTLDRIGIPLRDAQGNNLPSAYMAADVLASQHRDKFTELVPATREALRNLPAGAIVVWDRNPDPAKRAANPGNGFSHGHIEITDGQGGAYSDGAQRWGVTMNNNGRYGQPRIFLPNS